MAAIISKALRDEVLSAARAKHAQATAVLTALYRERARAATRKRDIPYDSGVERRIDVMMERQLRLS